jgi:lipopolysaccharide biosynthesis glycosyltransferase
MSSPIAPHLHVATAADDQYALPLAVTIGSVLRHLDARASLSLYILDAGIRPRSKGRLLKSWRDSRLHVNWIPLDIQRLSKLPVSGHVTLTTYARLLLPSHLPANLGRVIYLDSDLLVRRDLAALWNEPLDGAACLAVPDSAAPRLNAEQSLPNYRACERFLAATRPIPNYCELGLDASAAYFNAGVLSIDLAAWRRLDVAEEALRCLNRYRAHVVWWDQYAMNVVLHGRWRPLDMRWNQGAHIYRYPSAEESPFDAAIFETLRNDPWVVHFTSPVKPWHSDCDHPFTRDFLGFLQETDWRGWKPEKPYLNLSEWLTYQYGRYRKWRKDRKHRLREARVASSRRAA